MVIPGILEDSWEKIEEKIKITSRFSNKIHIDFVDGIFAENKTFLDPTPFSKYSKNLFFEAHLMVSEPINYLDSLFNAGFKRFIGHIEKMEGQAEFIAKAQGLGEAGLAIDGPTPISNIKVPIGDLDILLFLSIKAGFSGQKFHEDFISKVRDLKDTTLPKLEIDGGIDDKTISIAKQKGFDTFVSTSFIFNSPNPSENYKKLVEYSDQKR